MPCLFAPNEISLIYKRFSKRDNVFASNLPCKFLTVFFQSRAIPHQVQLVRSSKTAKLRYHPASGPLTGHGGASEWQRSLIDPPRGRPVGGGGIPRLRGFGGISPHHQLAHPRQRQHKFPSSLT